jgi:fructose-1,6-bisphosphatase/sedoheptulose 1,7-bisphosphatase-like protein
LMTDTSGIHALMWIGAAPEWTITAVAVKALGGQMSAKLMPYDSDMKVKNIDVVKRMKTMWASEDTIYTADDLATGDDVLFAATGVTSGTVLEWISEYAWGYVTDTLLLSSGDRPIQYIKTVHKVMHEIEM